MWVTYARKVPPDTRNAGGPRAIPPRSSPSPRPISAPPLPFCLPLHSWAQPCSTLPALSAQTLTQVLLLGVMACGCRGQVTTLTWLQGCVVRAWRGRAGLLRGVGMDTPLEGVSPTRRHVEWGCSRPSTASLLDPSAMGGGSRALGLWRACHAPWHGGHRPAASERFGPPGGSPVGPRLPGL